MAYTKTRTRNSSVADWPWLILRPGRLVFIGSLAFSTFSLFLFAGATTNQQSKPTWSQDGFSPARLNESVSVHAAGRGSPTINLTDGREILTNHVGPGELRRALEQNRAQPRSLDSADFDEDGVP